MSKKRGGANREVEEKNSVLVITLFELCIKLHLKQITPGLQLCYASVSWVFCYLQKTLISGLEEMRNH